MKECLGEEKPRKKNSKKSKVEVSLFVDVLVIILKSFSNNIIESPPLDDESFIYPVDLLRRGLL